MVAALGHPVHSYRVRPQLTLKAEAEQPAALVPTIKMLTEQRTTPDSPAVAVRMQELAEARELVVPCTRVAMEGVPRVAAAVAALAVPVKQEVEMPMVVTEYLATSRALRFFMAVAVADLLTYQRLALEATAVAAQAAEPLQMALQAQTV
jgi:hypothetical protein